MYEHWLVTHMLMMMCVDLEADAGANLSRMSTAPVTVNDASSIQVPPEEHLTAPADASRLSDGITVSVVADVSLPPMPDVAMPAPIDDLSFHAASSIAEPMSVAPADDFDDTAFNETLQSAAADITLFAVSQLPLCTVSQKKSPLRNFLTFFPKWLGIFSPNFTCLLNVQFLLPHNAL